MALSVDRGALKRYIETSLRDLPSLPPIVARVIELSHDQNASAADLDRVISSDPAMASKVLRVVNSAYYGLSRQIGSTAHALVILGMRQVQNIVLSMAAMSVIKSRSPVVAATQVRFWRHSYGAAAATKSLADLRKIAPTDAEKAIMGALLHDIGILFLYGCFNDVYTQTLKYAEEKQISLSDAEMQVLGVTHAQVGELITLAWKFPEHLSASIREHEGRVDGEVDPVIALVHAGDHLSRHAGFATVDAPEPPMNPIIERWLSLSEEDHTRLLSRVTQKVRDAEEFFGII